MGTGFYVADFHPPEIVGKDEEAIAEAILDDMAEGAGQEVGEGRVRPGIIGEVGLSWPVHPAERTALRGAAKAQQRSGYGLTIHPGRDPRAPMDAIRTIEEAGGDPTRVAIGHLDRTIFTLDDFLELGRTGCFLEQDLFGLESSYYPMSDIDMPNDAMRVNRLVELVEAGLLGQLLVSLDIDTRARLTRYGGEGYQHLVTHVVPVMRRKGLDQAAIDTIMMANPRRLLTIA
jgi:phosphotriesterase-related protein